jgi:hypothetical protein
MKLRDVVEISTLMVRIAPSLHHLVLASLIQAVRRRIQELTRLIKSMISARWEVDSENELLAQNDLGIQASNLLRKSNG